jgi:putative nucleotidyltransferase with HDIG domain
MLASATIDLEKLLATELPGLPDAAMRVASLTQDLNASARKIAEAIGCDPVLGARVLRAANSPLYALQRSVTALPMAVNAIGNENIYLLVVASATADTFQRRQRPSSVETALWRHSVAVGMSARNLMLMLNLRGMEEAFLCGLLHDIGKLLLLRYDVSSYQQLLKTVVGPDLLMAERETFGFTHAQIGGLAVKRWDLPEEICHAICYHHEPSQAEHSMLMARVLDVADMLVNNSGAAVGPAREYDLANCESVVALGVSEERLKEIQSKTESGMNEVTSLFS